MVQGDPVLIVPASRGQMQSIDTLTLYDIHNPQLGDLAGSSASVGA